MRKVASDDLPVVPHQMGVNSERRPVSRAIDDMDFAMVLFELEPGESFSGALHKHLNQQEPLCLPRLMGSHYSRTTTIGIPAWSAMA